MAMTCTQLAKMTWNEVEALTPESLICILPVGATEAHGPHLPLATDTMIALAMARAGGEALSQAGYTALILPALPYTAAEFARDFAGTVSIPGRLVTEMIVEVARPFAHAAAWVIANAHLDPANLESLQAAADRIENELQLPTAFPNLTRRPYGTWLGDEFRSGACHAGQFEGSIVLAQTPEDVREDIRATLPERPISLSKAIRAGKRTFLEAGGDQAYFGAPARASATEGHAHIETLARIVVHAVQTRLCATEVGSRAPRD